MIGRGNYVVISDVAGNMTRFTPAAVELFGLEGEYISSGYSDWSKYVHPEDSFKYTRTIKAVLGGELPGFDMIKSSFYD